MAQLIVRNLDDELVKRLKLRAAEHNRSVEAEHRAILYSILMDDAPLNFKEWLLSLSETAAELPITRDQQDKGRDVSGIFT
jgi:plasmid stability protein